MDPQMALQNLLETLHLGDSDEALIYLGALSQWLGNGGYVPNVPAALDSAGIKCGECKPYANVPAGV